MPLGLSGKGLFMDVTPKNHPTTYMTWGILAHVDAGKTTLAEYLLYLAGSIRKVGRVDHGDTFLDTDAQERARGITIFSKQARLTWDDKEITLLDTPGHTDFSAEMERTLQVLDYAILVISGTDGLQGHSYTLWKLLKRHEIPTFIFVNKMDIALRTKETLLEELSSKLGDGVVDFTDQTSAAFIENVAMCDEHVLEQYLESGVVTKVQISKMIAERKVFPCFFGSALKGIGTEEFMTSMSEFTNDLSYGIPFGGRVFKISRDAQDNRLTHIKLTSGNLKVKDIIAGEKINQIRLYSGTNFVAVLEVFAGQVCALTGLNDTYIGQGLGTEEGDETSILEPVLNYQIILPYDADVHQSYLKLQELEEEDLTLHLVWKKETSEIHIQLMGEVQIEVLREVIYNRFKLDVTFGTGSIVYKERIASGVEGVGHFEPLRHYAEVHLWMEPGEPGSGLIFDTDVSEDILDKNWQRLILTHLEERVHKGVLTGSELTDTKITLINGKAHIKHTEGGDFRQATYRAVRHGLMNASSELLEPIYRFRLEVPTENIGRAMNDIQRMQGKFDTPETDGEMSVLTGTAPVALMQGYQKEVANYTRGKGRFSCELKGYESCHNAEEVIAAIAYEPEADLEHTPDSVFCAHGAGFVVPWQEVYEYMHLEKRSEKLAGQAAFDSSSIEAYQPISRSTRGMDDFIAQDEIDEIFKRTFGEKARTKKGWEGHKRKEETPFVGQSPVYKPKVKPNAPEYLLVDGYNIIYAWDDLKILADVNIDAARDKLADILCDYQGYKKCNVILVFDAYRVKNHAETVIPYHNIHIVYTKEAETADHYIARTASKMEGQYNVTVATSDALVQMIIWGKGAKRLSANGLQEEVMQVKSSMTEVMEGAEKSLKHTVLQEEI